MLVALLSRNAIRLLLHLPWSLVATAAWAACAARGAEADLGAEVGLALPADAVVAPAVTSGNVGVGVRAARGRGGLEAVARGSVPLLAQLEAARGILEALDAEEEAWGNSCTDT